MQIHVPLPIAQAVRQGHGRDYLIKQFLLSENDARFYVKALTRSDRHLPGDLSATFPYRALILADLHVPHHDESALAAALNRIAPTTITHLVLLGDIVDFYQISFWARNPEHLKFRDEVELCRGVLQRLAARFPAAQKFYIQGNHEERLPKYLWSRSPELHNLDALSVPALLRLEATGWTYIDNPTRLRNGQGAFSLGGVALLHGHEVKVSYGAVNVPRLYYQRIKRPLIVAHHHKTDAYYPRLLDHRYDQAHSVGCLCELSPEYSLVNDWNHGYLLLSWNDTTYQVENCRCEN